MPVEFRPDDSTKKVWAPGSYECRMLNKSFSGKLTKDKPGGWTYLTWPESATFLETRKPVKVKGTIEGHAFEATFLPLGDGTHILPVRAPLLKAIKKQVGDEVEVVLQERL